MSQNTKQLFQHYLSQLDVIISKIPEEHFDASLVDGMFTLEMNAKVAAQFVMRGYCPLLDQDVVSFFKEELGKDVLQQQIAETQQYLQQLPVIEEFDDSKRLLDKAGFAEVELCQSQFIYQYIFPNFLFHMSMVYAIAKANGVELSKGDFDGLHEYPPGFRF